MLFVRETNYQPGGGVYVYSFKGNGPTGWCERQFLDSTANWARPGFSQGWTNPVVGVSWDDAHAFCRWLTARERKAGSLGPGQSYRLMTWEEWTKAVGSAPFPWGSTYPPPPGMGNFRDQAFASTYSQTRFLHNDNALLPGLAPDPMGSFLAMNDGYDRTSPVGRFAPNPFGLYDMSGNVWQWSEDAANANTTLKTDENPGAATGGSWNHFRDSELASTFVHAPPGLRADDIGFRVVLAISTP